jgi:hypothetical protein
MNAKTLFSLLSVAIIFIFTAGCATVFTGYEDTVDLINAPDDLKIYTKDGIEIPIQTLKTQKWDLEKREFVFDQTFNSIQLRTNRDYFLIMKSENKEKIIEVYPTLDAGWAILDFLLVFPWIVDAYTGCWNGFSPIVIDF